MTEKIPLKEKLAAVDIGARNLWDELDEDNQKALKSELFILNRYVSNVRSNNREIQEHFVLTVNEFFNKHWYTLQKHPKLLWQLLCLSTHETKKVFYHEWIGFKKKQGNNKKINFLMSLYPTKKAEDIELLSNLLSPAEIKQLAESMGYSDKEIKNLL